MYASVSACTVEVLFLPPQLLHKVHRARIIGLCNLLVHMVCLRHLCSLEFYAAAFNFCKTENTTMIFKDLDTFAPLHHPLY